MRFHFLPRVLTLVVFGVATPSALAGDILVSAAASLTNAFKEIGQAYENQRAGTKVRFNFGASGALLQQISKGAPVDVFASADQETMDMAEKQGVVQANSRQDFVRNTLVLIVPAENKLPLKQLADLGKAEVSRIAISNPASVPAGRYSKHALDASKLWTRIEHKIISTQNVRQSLDYVARGEVDAGFVYATDAALMKHTVKVAFEVPLDVGIRYPIAKTARAANPEEAARFVKFVQSPDAQSILARYGFLKP